MAIAIGTVTTGSGGAAASSLTVSHTAGTGSNTMLLVLVACQDTTTISSCKYNGVTMTSIARASRNFTTTEAFYLATPSTGANNIVVTFSGTTGYPMLTAIDLTGAAQSSPVDSSATGTGTASPVSTATTTTVNNSVVFDSAAIQTDSGDITLTVGGSQTQRSNFSHSSQERQGTSSQLKATAGSVTMSWTESANRNWAQVVFGIKEATASGPTNLKSLDTNLKANIKSYNTNVIANVKSINTNS